MAVPGSVNPMMLGGGQPAVYSIDQSLRFNSADSAYLNRTPGSAGNGTTWTWSGWVKRSALVSGTSYTLFSAGSAAQPYTLISFVTGTVSDQLGFDAINAGSVVVGRRYTTQVFRDPSAWYHFVFVWDTTNGTASSRMRIYVNGEIVTTFSLSSDPSSSATTQVNTTNAHYIGAYPAGGNYLNGYLAEVNFIDGSALDATDFGEPDDNGVWRPIRYAGSYTGNSFYLKFASGDGTDSSGLSNTWTANNFTTSGTGTDVMDDTPTNNYATPNPLDAGSSSLVFSNGNLDIGSAAGNWTDCRSTFAVSSGKWYWETTLNTVASLRPFVGILNSSVRPASNSGSTTEQLGETTNSYAYWAQGGFLRHNAVGTTVTAAVATDIVQVALDMDNGKIYFGLNNTYFDSSGGSTGNPSTGSNPSYSGITLDTVSPAFELYNGTSSVSVNFGQRAFAYTPPTGFEALNTSNLSQPDIANGSDYFQSVLDTGANILSSAQSAFSNGLWWVKDRDNSNQHQFVDSVRGSTSAIFSPSTVAAGTYAAPTGNSVAWCWREDATPGFDIVTYTGNGVNTRTISHGLGVAPAFFITKNLDGYNNTQGFIDWSVYHQNLPNYNTTGSQALYLMSTLNAGAAGGFFTRPTSTVFTPNQTGYDNVNTKTYVAYLWSEVEGFSKFGSYTGNGTTTGDGPFVWCGFRPAFIVLKSSSASDNWRMYDNKRLGYNPNNSVLYPNSSVQEGATTDHVDILSNGFKLRSDNNNTSGVTYIFMCFAENPFGGSGISPATAR